MMMISESIVMNLVRWPGRQFSSEAAIPTTLKPLICTVHRHDDDEQDGYDDDDDDGGEKGEAAIPTTLKPLICKGMIMMRRRRGRMVLLMMKKKNGDAKKEDAFPTTLIPLICTYLQNDDEGGEGRNDAVNDDDDVKYDSEAGPPPFLLSHCWFPSFNLFDLKKSFSSYF